MARTIKRQTKRTRKTSKKYKSRRQLRGGKVFGRGTYGIILGEPRMPCENEEFIRDSIESKQEVTKLFFNENEVKNVVSTLELLNKSFSKDELKNLNKYFILPENLCKINKKEIKQLHSIYNDEWREGNDLSKYNIQITFDQGKHNLHKELMSLSNKGEVITFLKKLTRIIEGIYMIHSKNIIHGDLKLENTIVDLKGNFKIIDVDELRDIETLSFDADFFYENHSYSIWPTLVNIFLINYYKIRYSSNDEFLRLTLGSPFNVDSSEFFHTEYDTTLSLISRENFKTTILDEKEPSKYTEMSDKIFKILVKNHGKNSKDHLKAIYTFIDRYSFGIILLGVLKRYFEIVGVKDDDSIVADLLEIIEDCCFIKNGLKTTTKHIKTEYIKFAKSL